MGAILILYLTILKVCIYIMGNGTEPVSNQSNIEDPTTNRMWISGQEDWIEPKIAMENHQFIDDLPMCIEPIDRGCPDVPLP